MPKYFLIVGFESEEPLDRPDRYVDEAVSQWRGCCHPESAEFGIDPDSVTVNDVSDIPYGTALGKLIGAE